MFQGTLDPISNRADWFGTIELINDDTGEVLENLDGISVKIEVRDDDRSYPLLTASTADGRVTFLGGGVIQWHFPPSFLRNICAGSYDLGVIISRDGITVQQLIATLPIIDGVVRP